MNRIPLSARDYRWLKCKLLFQVFDNKKSIHTKEYSHSEIKYYCQIVELSDITESAGYKWDHKKRQK